MPKKVKKRDGSIESYEKMKVARVVTSAGLNAEQAQLLSTNITLWIQNTPEDTVSSLEIRDKVLELLSQMNEDAANLYSWYQKSKEKT